MRVFFLVFAVFVLIMPCCVDAQTYAANPQYRQMVRQLLTYIPPDFNFGIFRRIYTQTEFYDPIGEQPVSDLLSYAYQVDTAKTPEEEQKASENYHAKLVMHLADAAFVRQAYVLAKNDPRFGDAKLLLQIYQGLLESIMGSGDGTALSRAYDAVILSEEVLILGQLGYRIKETEFHQVGIKKYNMHFVQNPGPDDPITIFINVRIPLNALAERDDDKSKVPSELNFKGAG